MQLDAVAKKYFLVTEIGCADMKTSIFATAQVVSVTKTSIFATAIRISMYYAYRIAPAIPANAIVRIGWSLNFHVRTKAAPKMRKLL